MKRVYEVSDTVDACPEVRVIVARNKINHSYQIREDLNPLTETPHMEILGIDVSSRVFPGAGSMDERTRSLYDAVKALHTGISSVSIEPYELSVRGPESANRRGQLRSEWPHTLDAAVVGCLAEYLKAWDVRYAIHHQTDRESVNNLNMLVAEAIAAGAKPPADWPFAR